MATKRQLKAMGIVVNPYVRANRPNNDIPGTRENQAKPNLNPETLTRQQVRAMLRAKAHKDIMQNYGRIGERNQMFAGYLGFSRRGRRRVQHAIARRWYKQIVWEQQKHHDTSRARGWIKSLINRVTGSPTNTLAASGVAGR